MSGPVDDAFAELRGVIDHAYSERNQLLAAFTKTVLALGFNAWLAKHPEDGNWDPEWMHIVFVEHPKCGQMSWHIHESERALFNHLPAGSNTWDGHTTPEKYERLRKL